MRLINVATLELEEVVGSPKPYAILSHRWGLDEVSYQDFLGPNKREGKHGFEKIKEACNQAKEEGIGYAWVDTCCIDKTSSADLSEAINSMFAWYQNATVCYAYLSDVPGDDDLAAAESKFSRSRWFTRGWTLQELIAPAKLTFYGSGWVRLGEKIDLAAQLRNITGIGIEVLQGKGLKHVSVAERMSWAAHRETTREEDIAYCLLGLFDVHMPMLYGEGTKAFVRLQEEILKDSEDHSLFAWRASTASANKSPYRGLLAASPAEFADCSGIVPFRSLSANLLSMSITNRGVPLTSNLESNINLQEPDPVPRFRAGLNCRWGDDFESVIAIELVGQGGDRFLRASPAKLFKCSSHGSQATVYVAKSVHASEVQLLPGLERQHSFYISKLPHGMRLETVFPRSVPYSPSLQLLQLGEWVSDKAAVQLACPWSSNRILLILWAVMAPAPHAWDYRFDVYIASENEISTKLLNARKPKEHVEERVVNFIPGQQSVVVSIKRGKIQGFDMFVVDIKLQQQRIVVGRGFISWTSATRM